MLILFLRFVFHPLILTETTGFVEKLFECLTTKNYLGNPPVKEIPKEETKAAAPKPAETEEVTFLLSLFFVMLIFLYVQNYFKKNLHQ